MQLGNGPRLLFMRVEKQRCQILLQGNEGNIFVRHWFFLQQASTELAKVERNQSRHQFDSFLTVTKKKKKSNQKDDDHNLQRS